MMRLTPFACSLLMSIVLSIGCGSSAPEPEATEPPAAENEAEATPPAEPEAAEPEAPAGPTAQGDSFDLAATAGETPYAAGQTGTFTIRLTGRNGWHVNTEYPARVSLSGEGVEYPSATLAHSAAAAYEEGEARFEVPFSAGAGEHTALANVDFAMCNPANCVMERRTLSLNLAVQ